MYFNFLISKRFLTYNKNSKFISAISIIASVGIMIGVAVLIIALSVLDGFQNEIQNKIAAYYSHIDLSAFDGQYLIEDQKHLDEIKKIIGNDLQNISPYVGQVAVIRSSTNRDGIYIKGIEPNLDNSELRHSIIKGKYELIPNHEFYNVIVGKKLARKLNIDVDSILTCFTLRNYTTMDIGEFPNIFVFKVVGIYETGMSEYDDITAYVNIKDAQTIFNYSNLLSGYDVKLKDVTKADSIANFLTTKMGYPYYGKSIFRTHRNIFTWIELQKKPIPIVLGLIIIVAVFNIISTLLMIVLEKTNAIGVLKSLGASGKNIKTIFLMNGAFIGLVGTVAGNILGYLLLQIQIKYDLITIPEGIYFLDKVPIWIEPNTFILVSSISIILSLLCSYIPAALASKINPINAIKFN